MRIAKIRTPRLTRFAGYNSPTWLKTRSDGVDVVVILRRSRAAALGNDVRFSNTLKHHTPSSRVLLRSSFQLHLLEAFLG